MAASQLGALSTAWDTVSYSRLGDRHLRYLLIESMQWVCQIPRYHDAFERAAARHGKNIARIIVARMLLRSIFKMLHDGVRFNQVPAA
jgi:hypothetical protein